jgi:hypothetical protein
MTKTRPKNPPSQTGLSAMLAAFLHIQGIGASKTSSAGATGTPKLKLASFCISALTLAAFATAASPALAAAPETPETGKANAVTTATTATLEGGVLNPHAAGEVGEYEYRFRVSATECEGESGTAPEPALGAEKEAVPAVHLTSLQPNAEYSFCLLARNVAQEPSPLSPVKHFTTKPAPPAVTFEGVANIKATEATFEGVVNPNNQLTECHFQYGTLSVSEHELPCTPETLKGYGEQVVSPTRTEVKEGNLVTVPVPITGLTPDTVYHYRILTKNGSGEEGIGTEETFETALPPETPGKAPATSLTATEEMLHGVLNPGLSPGEERKKEPGSAEFHYRQSSSECEGAGETTAGTSAAPGLLAKEPTEASVTELQPGTQYTFCLLVRNEAGEETLGPPETFTTLAAKPTLAGEATAGQTASTADLDVRIDPNGAATEYHFEYDTMAYHEGEAAHGTSTAAVVIPAGNVPVAISQKIEGLEPNREYHWRVIAANTAGSVTSGDQVFDYLPGSEPLPDARAYEMVTPPYKDGALIGSVPLGNYPQVSADGSHLIFSSLACFDQSVSCVPAGRSGIGVPFSFSRTSAGWVTGTLAPSASEYETNTSRFYSVESQTAVFGMPTAPDGEDDFYGRGPSGVFTDIGPFTPPADGPTTSHQLVTGTGPFEGSSDLSHIVFQADQFWPYSVTAAQGKTVFQYPNGGRREPALVGVSGGLGSTDLISECRTSLGGDAPGAAGEESADGKIVYFLARGECTGTGVNAEKSVSVEAEFARVDGGEAGAHTVAISEPYAPEVTHEPDDECTEAECRADIEQPGNWQEANFQGTSSEGTRAFFTSEQRLTDQATQGSNNLYLYDMAAPEGHRWVDVSAGEGGVPAAEGPRVQSVLAYANDGSHVYFVAQGALTKTPNAEGKHAEGGAENLYLYQRECPGGEASCATPTTRTVFITAMTLLDIQELGSRAAQQANVSPDGRFLVFPSRGQLTSDVTRTDGARQVYRYDAQTGLLQRISIGERGYHDDGNSGSGDAYIVPGDHGYARLGEARPDPTMANNGTRVFFMSPLALTPGALNDVALGVNGRGNTEYAENVYEWEQAGVGPCPAGSTEGCVYLISDGHDTSVTQGTCEFFSAVCLLGSDGSGQNVFFTTADQLVKSDTDTQLDVYDARVCEPASGDPCITEPAAVVPCLGEACHGTPPASPPALTGGSSTFNGEGNLTPALVLPTTRTITRAQKLADALKACKKDKKKSKRQTCEKQAKKKYGAAKKSSKKKGK